MSTGLQSALGLHGKDYLEDSDSDLTPRPLRVTKDTLAMSNKGHESFVTAVEDQGSAVPLRRSSLTQRSTSSSIHTRTRTQRTSPNRDKPLHVPRQRINQTISQTPRDTSSLSRADSHMLLFETLARKQAKREASILGPGFRKAVRTGVLPQRLSRKLITPVSNVNVTGHILPRRNQSENLRPSTPRLANGQQNRAVTDGQVYKDMASRSHQPPSQRFSLKDRLLKRSTGGKVSEKASSHEEISDKSLITKAVERNRDRSKLDSTIISTSSFERSLRAFPLPPTKDRLISISHHDPEEPPLVQRTPSKQLSEPYEPSFLAGKLSFTPEFESVSFENGESIFALAQFEATVSSVSIMDQDPSPASALDFVVIIDNSSHTSPSTLMAHCETARYLASILDPVSDQIGILCTSWNKAFSNVMDLADIDLKLFKRAIDRIGTFCDDMESVTLHSLLGMAQDMLLVQATNTAAHSRKTAAYGHICVLTHQTDNTLEKFSLDSRLTLHVICSDALPIKQADLPSTNGWRLRSLSRDYPWPLSRNGTKQRLNNFAKGIDSLVSQARTGQKLGKLKNVEWELCSCKDTTIEKVWGIDRVAEMQPGEVSTLIVKIRCKMPKIATTFRAGLMPSSLEEDDDMFGEIERLFAGLSGTPLLRAAVSYSQSSLPTDTVCATMGTCYARRHISSPGSSTLSSRSTTALYSTHRVAVHTCLALHCFSELDPEDAVAMLKNVLGEGNRHVACGALIATLVKQHRYRTGQYERRSHDGVDIFSKPSFEQSNRHLESASPSISPTKRHRETSGSTLQESKRKGDRVRGSWTDVRLEAKPSVKSQNRPVSTLTVSDIHVNDKGSVGNIIT